MQDIVDRLKVDKDYRLQVYKLVYNTITEASANLTPASVADCMSVLKVRDAVMHGFFTNRDDRAIFYNWFNKNQEPLSKLTDAQKAHILSLMSGVLLMDDEIAAALATCKLCKTYAELGGVSANLADLITTSITAPGLDKPNELFNKSLAHLTLDQILS